MGPRRHQLKIGLVASRELVVGSEDFVNIWTAVVSVVAWKEHAPVCLTKIHVLMIERFPHCPLSPISLPHFHHPNIHLDARRWKRFLLASQNLIQNPIQISESWMLPETIPVLTLSNRVRAFRRWKAQFRNWKSEKGIQPRAFTDKNVVISC